jgi:hypothetical protein
MPSLKQRLTVLEQVRERASVMHILHPGAHENYGDFKVITGRREYIEERLPDEVWRDFQSRMDAHAVGLLRLLQFVPIDETGCQLYMNEPDTEYLQ